MAKVLSGSFDTNTINNRYLTFSWTGVQDYSKNQTTITWQLKCNGTATTYNMSAPFYVEIDGEQVYYDTTRIKLTVGKVVKTGTKVITHNSDGTRKFSANVKAAIYEATYNAKKSGTWELSDIPRKATLTKVPTSFTDEDSPTIEFKNHLGNSVDKLSVCLSLDNYYATIPYREVDKNATKYTFNFTPEEKALIYQYTKNTDSLSVSFYIKTDMDGLSDSENKHKLFSTLNIKNADPEITLECNEVGYQDLIGDPKKFIRDYNKIHCVATPTLKKGATAENLFIINRRDKYIDGAEGYIENTDVDYFDAGLDDSRGKPANANVKLTMIEYIPLTCNVEAEIKLSETDTEQAEIKFTVSGNYFNQSFGAKHNSLRIEVNATGSNGGATSEVVEISDDDFDGDTYSVSHTITGLSYKETWIVNASASDEILKNVVGRSKSLTSVPVFDWSDEDFNFNVPVSFSAGIDLPQTLLYTSGGVYLHDGQSVKLSGDKMLSKQTLGYFMVWYDFTSKVLTENSINYTFIPKYLASASVGKITVPVVLESGLCGAKTITVSETETETTLQGSTFNDEGNNGKVVLRYVIGV